MRREYWFALLGLLAAIAITFLLVRDDAGQPAIQPSITVTTQPAETD